MQTKLPQSCQFKDAASLAKQLDAALLAAGSAPLMQIECADVRAMDSSLIAVLLDLKRRSQQRGCSIALLNPPINLQRLAKLYGLDQLLFARVAELSH